MCEIKIYLRGHSERNQGYGLIMLSLFGDTMNGFGE
jgi:hypothetical protein